MVPGPLLGTTKIITMMLHEITENNNYYAVKFYSVVTVLIATGSSAVSSVCTVYQGRRGRPCMVWYMVRCAPGNSRARPGSRVVSYTARSTKMSYSPAARISMYNVHILHGSGSQVQVLWGVLQSIRMESAKIAVYSQIILSSRTENGDKTADKAQQS